MKTREERNARQRELRAMDTPSRQAMINWNNSEAGKAALKKCYLKYKETRKPANNAKNKKARDESRKLATKANSEWTMADDHKLLVLKRVGFKQKAIGITLGRSIKAVEARYRRIKENESAPVEQAASQI